MQDFDCETGPVEILHRFDDGRMTLSEVIHWAEQQVATGGAVGGETELLDIASLPVSEDNSTRAVALLEKLIANVDLSVKETELTTARVAAASIIRNGELSSIRRTNCIEFVLGCCPSIALPLSHKRRFFGGHDPGLYNELSAFNEYLFSLLKQPDANLTQEVQCIEAMFALGDAKIQEAALVGILEGIVNLCMNNRVSLNPLLDQLLPKSRLALEKLDRFWQEDSNFDSGRDA